MASSMETIGLRDRGASDNEKAKPTSSSSTVPLIEKVAAAEAVTVRGAQECGNSDGDIREATGPLAWSYKYKMFIVVLVSAMTLMNTFATLISVPAIPDILSEFHSTDQSYLVLLVSIWELGEGIGPFIIAPLSEIYGRLPVYHGANVLFFLFTIGGALSNSLGMLVAFRFLNGLSCVSMILGPAMVGDMFRQDERGGAMAALYMGPLLGPVLAPVVGGFLAKAAGWRWTFWLIAIAVAVIQIPSFVFMRETNGGVIRARKATGANQAASSEERKTAVFRRAILRPLRFLFSPVVFAIALYVAIVYGYLYIILTTLTSALESIYGFSESSSGLAYLGIAIGMATGVILCGLTSDAYIKSKGSSATPEHRLPPMALGAILIPIGLFLYGWTMRSAVHWIVPLLGTAVVGFGLLTAVIPAESYLVDAYTAHSAAAIAAASFVRQVFGTVLPLVGPPLYAGLGLGWGNSVLAFVAVGLAPVPVLFMRFGGRARGRWGVG